MPTAVNQNTGTDLRFLREPEVLQRFPFSRAQLWALIKRGEFPAPVKLSERCSAWRSDLLNAHAESLTPVYKKTPAARYQKGESEK